MINAYEKAGGETLTNKTPIALAMRWLDATEAQIEGDDTIEGKDFWHSLLGRVETIAQVDMPILLQLADMQRVTEELPPDEEGIYTMGNVMQLALVVRGLNERAQLLEETLGAGEYPYL